MTASLGNTGPGTPFATGVDSFVYPQFIGYAQRAPSTNDVYNPGTQWQDNSVNPFVIYETTGAGIWYQITGGGTAGVSSVNGSNGVTASPTSGNVIVSGVNATTSTVGVASFNPLDFTVSGAGEVSLIGTTPNSYVNVTFADSPYTATADDYFISVDCSGGKVTIILPSSTTVNRQFIIKDRLGFAAANNITVSAGGVTTIDQSIANVFTDNFDSLEVLFHTGTPPNYEVF